MEALEKWEPSEVTIENFRLPFPVCAFEESSSRNASGKHVVVFENEGDPSERMIRFVVADKWNADSIGVATGIFKAIPSGKLDLGGNAANQSIAEFKEIEACLLHRGRVSPIDMPSSSFSGGDSVINMTITKEDHDREWRKAIANIVDISICLGVLRVLVVNTPSEFIVEERPEPYRGEVRNANRILRSQHRPHYIVLNPKEIKTRFLNEPEPDATEVEAIKRRPHERRGHYRKLQSERFRKARGNVIWIDALWVGPQEAVVGKNRYKVLLDR